MMRVNGALLDTLPPVVDVECSHSIGQATGSRPVPICGHSSNASTSGPAGS